MLAFRKYVPWTETKKTILTNNSIIFVDNLLLFHQMKGLLDILKSLLWVSEIVSDLKALKTGFYQQIALLQKRKFDTVLFLRWFQLKTNKNMHVISSKLKYSYIYLITIFHFSQSNSFTYTTIDIIQFDPIRWCN